MNNTVFTAHLSKVDQRVFARFVAKHSTLMCESDRFSTTLEYLVETLEQKLEAVRISARQNERFKKRARIAQSDEDMADILLDYAKELGAGTKQLKQDRRALTRHFDAEALNDRFARNLGDTERELVYLTGRLAVALAELPAANSVEIWRQRRANQLLEKLLVYGGDVRVRIAAVQCVGAVFKPADISSQPGLDLSVKLAQGLFRSAQTMRLEPELQMAAFAALARVSPVEFTNLAISRLTQTGIHTVNKDDFFVRAEIARAACLNHASIAQMPPLLDALKHDNSDFVRQELVRAAPSLPADVALELLRDLLRNDKVDKVRASAVFVLCRFDYPKPETLFQLGADLAELLLSDDNELLVRATLDTVPRLTTRFTEQSELMHWFNLFEPKISQLHLRTDNLKIRRWASSSREALWVQCHDGIRARYHHLKQHVSGVTPGRSTQLPKFDDIQEEQLGRIFALIAQEDFGYDVQIKKHKIKLTRWHRFKFRLWRFLYELRNSASDKRQAHKHMIGRVFYGLMSAPSGRVAEQTLTKVPGEPVTVTAEDGPRNYLPLVDELISCLDQSWPTKPLKIFTSEGITLITPPNGFVARLKARWILTWRFDYFASLRNWQEGSTGDPNEYLTQVAKLGFVFSMQGYTQDSSTQLYPVHRSLSRFLPAYAWPSLALIWGDVKDYFVSVYSNSLTQLWAFMLGLLTLFVGKHAVANRQMNRARQAIPLSIGGWGTRGKSGTERLKAAVFNGLGLRVISKTTGCEAMFLEGGAHQPLRELFLFRPYDKATIWEQVDLVKIAAELDADVFLWECMGLTPAYVHILQRHWMQDDIATITNTYPDHEDVQGPAGIDIPIVMNEFIPKNSTLVTSEEIMLPILRAGCRVLNTDCEEVSWRDTMTVTDDILGRFPYEEHQNNIALVARMCERLGVQRHVALKSMADNVVLDLGVLKTYPRSRIDDRTLEYVMGNSANERLGAMGNWRRMGFEQSTLAQHPEIWVSTLVNNRADRIPRSKVFASMLVNDISADAHVIVGTNVDGFETFLHEAWEEKYAEYSIWQSDHAEAKQRCYEIAQSVRIATDVSQISTRIDAMCQGLNLDIEVPTESQSLSSFEWLVLPEERQHHTDHIRSAVEQWLGELFSFVEVIESLSSSDHIHSNERILELAKRALFSRVHCYIDASISGEEIITEIVSKTPPGLTNRIMGMQNIKGTGLDFVYRWQAWERCYQACQQLDSDDESVRLNGLKELRAFEEYGQLSLSYVGDRVSHHRNSPQFQMESAQADLVEVELKLNALGDAKSVDREYSYLDQPLIRACIKLAERFLDLGDAVKRRKQADQIYRDLVNYRISRARATVELQALTKRQKGDWLHKQLKG